MTQLRNLKLHRFSTTRRKKAEGGAHEEKEYCVGEKQCISIHMYSLQDVCTNEKRKVVFTTDLVPLDLPLCDRRSAFLGFSSSSIPGAITLMLLNTIIRSRTSPVSPLNEVLENLTSFSSVRLLNGGEHST